MYYYFYNIDTFYPQILLVKKQKKLGVDLIPSGHSRESGAGSLFQNILIALV